LQSLIGSEARIATQALPTAAYALIYITRVYNLGIVVTTIGTVHNHLYII